MTRITPSTIVRFIRTTPDGRPYLVGEEIATRHRILPLPVTGVADDIAAHLGETA